MNKVIDFQQVLKNTMEHDSQARLLSEFYTLTAVSKKLLGIRFKHRDLILHDLKEILDKITERLKEIEPQLKFK